MQDTSSLWVYALKCDMQEIEYEAFFLIVWPKFNINGINFKNELKFLYFGLRWETYVDFERSYNIFTWWINLYIKTTKEPLILYIYFDWNIREHMYIPVNV